MIKHFCTQTKSFEPSDILKLAGFMWGRKPQLKKISELKSGVHLDTPWSSSRRPGKGLLSSEVHDGTTCK